MKKFNLEDIDKHPDVFQTPEGYFNDLPQRVQKRVAGNRQPGFAPGFGAASLWQPAFMVLALLLAAGIAWYLWPQQQPQNGLAAAEENLEQVTRQEIYEYLLAEEVAQEEILEMVANESLVLNPLEDNVELTPELLEEIIDLEDVEDYL